MNWFSRGESFEERQARTEADQASWEAIRVAQTARTEQSLARVEQEAEENRQLNEVQREHEAQIEQAYQSLRPKGQGQG